MLLVVEPCTVTAFTAHDFVLDGDAVSTAVNYCVLPLYDSHCDGLKQSLAFDVLSQFLDSVLVECLARVKR